jgi:prophage maintenance system killer protein
VRIALVVVAAFAEINGYRLEAPESEAVDTMLRLADGSSEEEGLAERLRERLAVTCQP